MDKATLGRIVLKAAQGLCLSPEESTALATEVLNLKEVVAEVHSWIVCAAIAPPEDVMQNAPRIVEITSPTYSK